MAFPRLLIITLFCCFILGRTENVNTAGESQDSRLQISSVLDYLNSNSNGIYGYKSGSLISAQNKADITEVAVEVNVDCLKTYPEIPCNEHVLICHAFVRQNPDQTYQILSDVKCNPKIDIVVEDVDEVKHVSPMAYMEQSQGEMEKIDLSSEALSPVEDSADFVAVRTDNIGCPGCPFDLDTNAEGVEELVNTAIKHIESERSQRHKLLGIKRLQQQVVAGIKYILLAEVAQTVCLKDADLSAPCILDESVEPFICEIAFIQQPWISKSKHVIKNNCTVSQEFEPVYFSKHDQDDMNNEILPLGGLINPMPHDKPVPNYNAMAETGNMEEDMDADRLADLESQILSADMFESPEVSKVVESPRTLIHSTVAQPEFVSVDESLPMTTTLDDSLKVEPLNIENQYINGIPLFSSVPVIDESEPVVRMDHYHNDEHVVKTSDENTVSKDTKNYETAEFGIYIPAQERFKRELAGDSDSDSDSDGSSDESKKREKVHSKKIEDATVDIAKREVANTSEESSESDNTSEKRQRVKRQNAVEREISDTSEESSESENTSEKKHRVRRKTENTSEESSESRDTTGEKKSVVKRRVLDTSEESPESENTSEKRQRVKRKADNTSEESSQSDNSTEEKKDVRDKKRAKRNTGEGSSESSKSTQEDKQGQKRTKRANDNYNNDSSDSSSSSSPSNEHNNEIREEKYTKSKKDTGNNDSSSTSSSSSTSEDPNNDNNRHRRSIGQMEKISSDEKVIVRDLADFAAATLDNIDDDHHKRVILQILGAKKLKLDGIYYQIILRLGISHCHENEHNENCREKLLTNLTKICKVQVHVDDDYSNPKVVKSQCQNIKKDENDRNRTNYSRYRRAVLVGGHMPMSTDDPGLKKFVNTTLEHLDSLSDHPNKHKAVEVVSATSQVVAGVRYIITVKIGLSDCAKSEERPLETCRLLPESEPETCIIDVWDRPWLNKTVYRLNCNNTVSNFGDEKENTRLKREVMVGAPAKIAKDSEEVLSYVEKGLVYLDSQSEHENKYVVDDVLSATSQVVAGRLIRIRANVALSDCKKGSELKNCKKLDGPESKAATCKFKIWEKPWLNFTQTNVSCDGNQKYSFRSRRSIDELNGSPILGADKELSTDHLEAKNFVKMALEYLSSKSETSGKYKLRNINQVSRRVVAGALWNINADIALCRQVRAAFLICPDRSQHINCHFMVLNQPWLADGLTINITCENDDHVYTYMPVKGLSEESDSFDYKIAFKQFVRKYNKMYGEDEYGYRLKVFRDNANKIALLNKYEKGTARYGFTQFADLTEKEFSKSHGYRSDLRNENEIPLAQAKIPDTPLPNEFDWRTKGAVTEVKNQGFCGSCWAFSVTGNVEGQYAIKHGKLLEFSEQELVDCDKVDEGCNGGLMDTAYRVIEKLGGLETESDYPYEGDDEKCHFDISKVRVELTGALNISHNETDMAKWLVQNGPISIAINANAMQFYMGGVSHPWKMLCDPKNLDHGVLIVGYGVHKYSLFNKTLPYWVVKNSWGTTWGEQGYYRVYRGDGTCGLNETPSSAIVA